MTAAPDVDPLPAAAHEQGTARQVLLSSLELFADRGYHATSIRAIAEAVGIKSATLYDHFPSKPHIVARLVALGWEDVADRLAAALDGVGDDVRDQVAALVRAHVTSQADRPLLAKVTTNELSRVPAALAGEALAHRHRAEGLALTVYLAGEEQGVFQIANPVATIAAIGGIAIRVPYWFEPVSGYGVAELADDYVDLVLRMVGAAPRPPG